MNNKNQLLEKFEAVGNSVRTYVENFKPNPIIFKGFGIYIYKHVETSSFYLSLKTEL